MDANAFQELQQQNQLLQQQLQALQQTLQAVQAQQQAAQVQQQAPPPPAAQFALEPAQAHQAGLLNYVDRNDIELHKNGSKALPGDAYDGTKLQIWLGKVETRARSLGMENILTYNGALLTRRYGEITKEEVRNAAMMYHAARGRDAQNASIMFNFLSASITDTILAKVNTEPERYVLQIPVPNQVNQFTTVNDGTCALKAIIDHTYTNTLSCATAAREALSSLDTYMSKLPKSDIEKMNQYVREKVNELAAANQTTSDLVMNLFKGYAKAKDKVFRQWLQRKKDDYITRREIINPNGLELMEQVENYYKDRVNTGEWMKLDEDQETILALKAQLSNRDGGKNNKKRGKKGEKGDRKRKGEDKEDKENYEKPAWKLQAPKDKEKKTKDVDGKTYHWCTGHKEWTIHTSAECRINKNKDAKKDKDKKAKRDKKEEGSEKSEPKGKKQLTLKVLQTIADHVQEGEDSESCYSP
jgi:hypothetical protein